MAHTFTQLHHLPCSLYSSILVIFHNQFSVTVNTYLSQSHTTSASITISSFAILIHLTPAAALHITLTSFSLNCIAFHFLETMSTLSSQLVTFTHHSSSQSFGFITINQEVLIFLTSSRSSLLTVAFFVISMKCFHQILFISRIDVISSSFCRESRLIIGCHFAILVVSGIS